MKLYLAYGSNLNKMQMAHRCPDAVPVGKTKIPGYQLVFRRGVLTIERSPGSSVPAGLWRISDNDEKNLDRYEGYPRFYFKQSFPIVLNGQIKEAMAYIMAAVYPIQRASRSYLQTVGDGYRDFGIDPEPLIDADLEAYDVTRRDRND